MDLNKNIFNCSHTFKNLCFTNKTRIEINDILMKRKARKYHADKTIKLDKSPFDENSQDVKLCCSMPIIAHVNNKKLDIINNEEFKITKVNKDEIHIENERGQKIIQTSMFQQLFYLAFAITIHKSQGCTFTEPYTIHEWQRLNERLRYVALTRATTLENINVI